MALTTDWGKVAYWVSDDWRANRDTLFFLHGLTADHTLFAKQYPYFAKSYNVIAWDAPAHGKSRPFSSFTYEKAAQIVQKILDHLGISEAIFIGQSLGGFITQSVIKRYPECVKAFIAIDSAPFGETYYSHWDKWWLKQVEWLAYLYPLASLKKAIAKQVSATQTAYQNMLDMLSIYGKRELCHLMGIGYAGFLEDNCALDIPCPVLLLLGAKDKTGKIQDYNHFWSEKNGYPLLIIADAAHNANVDQPDTVNKAIAQFIAALP